MMSNQIASDYGFELRREYKVTIDCVEGVDRDDAIHGLGCGDVDFENADFEVERVFWMLMKPESQSHNEYTQEEVFTDMLDIFCGQMVEHIELLKSRRAKGLDVTNKINQVEQEFINTLETFKNKLNDILTWNREDFENE